MTSQDLVPEAWRDAFVLAMRSRDADGRRIGEALAEVEQFCRDSSRAAPEAFGSADEYAHALTDGSLSARHRRAEALSRAVGLVGMLLVLWTALADSGEVDVSVGNLLAAPLILAASPLVAHLVYRRRTGLAALTIGATVAALVSAQVFATEPVATVPRVAAGLVGAALLVGQATWQTRRELRDPTATTITSPWEPAEVARRRDVRAGVAAAWLFPAMTLVGVLVVLGVGALLG